MHHFSYYAILLYMLKEIPNYAFAKHLLCSKVRKSHLFFFDFLEIQLCFVHSMYK